MTEFWVVLHFYLVICCTNWKRQGTLKCRKQQLKNHFSMWPRTIFSQWHSDDFFGFNNCETGCLMRWGKARILSQGQAALKLHSERGSVKLLNRLIGGDQPGESRVGYMGSFIKLIYFSLFVVLVPCHKGINQSIGIGHVNHSCKFPQKSTQINRGRKKIKTLLFYVL